MNIKEAGRYANHLDSLITNLSIGLTRDKNLYKTIEHHQRKKANPEVEDEEIEVVEERLNCSINDLTFLISSLVDEKLRLSLAIDNAKNVIKLDWVEDGKNLTLDSAVEYNKKLRSLCQALEHSTNCKSSEMIKSGNSKKFNVEGNQVTYYYDIKVVKTIDFDKDVVKDKYKSLLDKTDKISKQIDEALLKDVVELDPKYSLYDSLEEIVDKYVESRKS